MQHFFWKIVTKINLPATYCTAVTQVRCPKVCPSILPCCHLSVLLCHCQISPLTPPLRPDICPQSLQIIRVDPAGLLPVFQSSHQLSGSQLSLTGLKPALKSAPRASKQSSKPKFCPQDLESALHIPYPASSISI